MTHYSFSCLLYVPSMVSSLHILTAILAGLTEARHEVDWVLCSTSSGHLEMSLSCSSPDRIKPDTPQPSFCCFPFLGQTLPTSKPPLFGIFMAAATIRPVCCASLLSLCLCRSRNQFVPLPLAAHRLVYSVLRDLVRLGCSSHSCLLFFVNALLTLLLLYHH